MSQNGDNSADSATIAQSNVDPEVIRRLLHGIPLGATQTVIVARGPQALAYRGALKPVEAADVAIYVNNHWRDNGQTLRIQFMRMPLLTAGRLLLTYPLRGEMRLIVVDHDDASLEQLHGLSGQLLGVLAVAGITRSIPEHKSL